MISIQEVNVAEPQSLIFPWMRDEVRASRFQVLGARLYCGIVVVGLGGNVLFANDAAARLFQCSPEDLVRRIWGFPLALGGISKIKLPRHEGDELSVEMQVTYIHWDGGKPAYRVSLHNISELSQDQSFTPGKCSAVASYRSCSEVWQ